jgi:NAD(P)-dependent dehydrogenase (short-subunit alcohol dehydrogenase family)
MKELRDRVAAVTGAASGIGRALAVNLAKQGCHLAISDINEEGLKGTADMIGDTGVKVTTHVVDVSDRAQVERYAEEVVGAHGGVHLVINNAGVVVSETLEDISYEDFEWLMGINLWGVIYGSKAFLPHLKRQPQGHIVNISSIYGVVTPPCNGAYCTAKFAVRGFTETLDQELKDTPVRVTCVHPGGIKTNIARNARFYKAPDPRINHEDVIAIFDRFMTRTTADDAARIIIEGIKKDRHRIMVGADAQILDMLKRMFPVASHALTSVRRVPRWMLKKVQGGR